MSDRRRGGHTPIEGYLDDRHDRRRRPRHPAARRPRRSRRCRSTRRASATRSSPRFLEAANASARLKARWHAQQVTAQRLGMSDHSWVHLQIVLNSALRIFRLLHRAGCSRDPDRLRDEGDGRRGGDRRRLPAARPRHVDPPRRPRVVQPLPGRRPARGPAPRRLRGARAHDRRVRDPARDHRPPPRRAAAHARGRDRAGRRRAGHGARPLARLARDPACRTSTRCRRPPSTRSGSSPASSARSASRSR